MQVNTSKFIESSPKFNKGITILIVISMLSVIWSSTVPTAKADGETPYAVIGFITFDQLDPETFDPQIFGAPCFTDFNGDGKDDILAYKINSGYVYYGNYTDEQNGNAHYNWQPLINLPAAMNSATRGVEDEYRLVDVIPTMTNFQDSTVPEPEYQDLVITSKWNPPKWFQKTGELDQYGLPEFEYREDLPINAAGRPLAIGELTDDLRPDIITTDSANNLILYNNTGTGNDLTFEGPIMVKNSTNSQIAFDGNLDIYPSLVSYDVDNDLDLIIASGVTEVKYYENTGSAVNGWVNRTPDMFQVLGCEQNKYLQFRDFNDEMTGLTGRDYGTDNGGLEILACSSEMPTVSCTFQYIYENDGTPSLRVTEGEDFHLYGDLSYTEPAGGNIIFTWDFDDGNTSADCSVVHSYNNVDNVDYTYFNVTLTADVSGNIDVRTIMVNITDSVPTPIITGSANPLEGQTEIFSSSYSENYEGDSIVEREWDNNYDGITFSANYTEENVSLLWSDDTPYQEYQPVIALRLTDDDGSTAVTILDLTIMNQPPSCELSLDPNEKIINNSQIQDESDFNASAGVTLFAYNVTDPAGLTNDPIVEYKWKVRREGSWLARYFSTESESKAFTLGDYANNPFWNSGTYTINLQVKDNDGAWSDFSNDVYYSIGDEAPNSADITVNNSITETDEGESIEFIPGSTTPFDEINRYEWDFDYDGVNFTIDGTSGPLNSEGRIWHTFYLNDGSENRVFDVAVRAVDYDGSESPIANLGEGFKITVYDTGFYESGEKAPEANVLDYSGPIEEGVTLRFNATINPKVDNIARYEWDFDYVDENFSIDVTSTHFWENVDWTDYRFDTYQGGQEHCESATFTVAVRAVDTDGTVSDPIVITQQITVNDLDPVANFTGTNYSKPQKLLTFDATPSISKMDGLSFEWDFDYDGMDFTTDETGMVSMHAFENDGDYSVALRVNETVGDSGESDIATMNVTIENEAAAVLHIVLNLNSSEELNVIEEEKEFTIDGRESEPPNTNEYYWDSGNGEFEQISANYLIITGGKSADMNLVEKDFGDGYHRYQEYTFGLEVKQQDYYASRATRILLIQDSEPDSEIRLAEDYVPYIGDVAAVKMAGTTVFTSPGKIVPLICNESAEFLDNPVTFQWSSSDGQVGVDHIMNFIWTSCGIYRVSVIKTDADGSVVRKSIEVCVMIDTDLDGFLDDFDDPDDDNDGVNDTDEIHVKIFKMEKTQPICGTDQTTGTRAVSLYYVQASGEILSATANIGIRHQRVKDLSISVGGKDIDLSGVGDEDTTFYRTIDLLGLGFSTYSFQHSKTWQLVVSDNVNGNKGFIEYFEILITHGSNPLMNDTDGDGLFDNEELTYGDDGFISDPCTNDSDGDGLSDYAEYTITSNPTSKDTDGDGSYDGNDADPLHDILLKIDIHNIKEYNSDEDDVFFRGTISDGYGNREFETAIVRNVYSKQSANGYPFSEGVYYYNIRERIDENYFIDLRIEARDMDDHDSNKLDLDGDSGNDANFRYWVNKAEKITTPESNSEIGSNSTSNGITSVHLDGAGGGSSGDKDVMVDVKISLSYADKIDTLLLTNETTVPENEDGDWRYVGEELFYLFLLSDSYMEEGKEREHALIVPKSTFFASNFYENAQAQTLNQLGYIPAGDDGQFITTDFDSAFGPVEIGGIFRLENLDNEDINDLIDDLIKTSDGTIIAKKYDLKPYSGSSNDDDHASQDIIHSIGLPTGLLQFIPNAMKSTESSNVPHPDDDRGFGYYLDRGIDGTKYWIGKASDHIDDLLLMTTGYGLADAYSLINGGNGVAAKVTEGWHAFEDKLAGPFYHWLLTRTSEYHYSSVQINETANNNMIFDFSGFSSNDFSIEGSTNILRYYLSLLSLSTASVPYFIGTYIAGALGRNYIGPTNAIRELISDSEDSFENGGTTGKIRYPGFGCPAILIKDDILTIYIDEEASYPSGTWAVDIIKCSTGNTFSLNNVQEVSSNLSYIKITAEFGTNVEDNSILYDIILKKGGTKVDNASHSLQLVKEFGDPNIIHISDVHVGIIGEERDLMKMIAKINERNEDNATYNDVDFVVLTGDIIQGTVPIGEFNPHGTRDSAYYSIEDEWVVAWNILQQLSVPIYMTPGNHDYYDGTTFDLGVFDGDVVDEDLAYYRKYMVPEFTSKTPSGENESDPDDYSFNYGDYHFIAVDSGEPMSNGFSSEQAGFSWDQLEWIKEDYLDYETSLPNGTNPRVFILTHAPVFSQHHFEKLGYTPGAWSDFTHKSPNDYHFVHWATETDPNSSDPLRNIEAILCGHTHEWRISVDIFLGYNTVTDKSITRASTSDSSKTYWQKFTDGIIQIEIE